MDKGIITFIILFSLLSVTTHAAATEIDEKGEPLDMLFLIEKKESQILFKNLIKPQVPGLELFGSRNEYEYITYNNELNQIEIHLLTYSRVNSHYEYPFPDVTVTTNGAKINTNYKYNGLECVVSYIPVKNTAVYEFSSIFHFNIADPHNPPLYISLLTSQVSFLF